MSTPTAPLDPQSPRGRELATGEFADALDDVEEAIKQRRAERDRNAASSEGGQAA